MAVELLDELAVGKVALGEFEPFERFASLILGRTVGRGLGLEPEKEFEGRDGSASAWTVVEALVVYIRAVLPGLAVVVHYGLEDGVVVAMAALRPAVAFGVQRRGADATHPVLG